MFHSATYNVWSCRARKLNFSHQIVQNGTFVSVSSIWLLQHKMDPSKLIISLYLPHTHSFSIDNSFSDRVWKEVATPHFHDKLKIRSHLKLHSFPLRGLKDWMKLEKILDRVNGSFLSSRIWEFGFENFLVWSAVALYDYSFDVMYDVHWLIKLLKSNLSKKYTSVTILRFTLSACLNASDKCLSMPPEKTSGS